jgi:hypothetical protein
MAHVDRLLQRKSSYVGMLPCSGRDHHTMQGPNRSSQADRGASAMAAAASAPAKAMFVSSRPQRRWMNPTGGRQRARKHALMAAGQGCSEPVRTTHAGLATCTGRPASRRQSHERTRRPTHPVPICLRPSCTQEQARAGGTHEPKDQQPCVPSTGVGSDAGSAD